ncbi:hypothetical protein EZV62_023185 [Acer yangbiense]|uniref:Uncharacterized protein n=1 Tax=Acer yangbiense TaxID=1000413 RepID=A0A5C7H1E6_9ROSI|nr:hypothetical protein EZV62_023185 [Acer yangbiense]
MAYRRSLSTRATLIARAYNNPSFSYIPRDHHDRDNRDSTLSRREVHNFIQQRSSFGRVSQFSLGSAFIRYMSTSVGEGGGSDKKIELMSNVADVVSDASITTQVNEVVIAAADSFFPVAALQHFIDAVHNFTGLNWCHQCFVIIMCVLQVKKKQMEQQMEEDKATDPEAVADCQKQMQKAHKENCTDTYRAFIRPTWVYIDYAVITDCFLVFDIFLVTSTNKQVSFMAKTFPDSFYLWPILIGQSVLIAAEIQIISQDDTDGFTTHIKTDSDVDHVVHNYDNDQQDTRGMSQNVAFVDNPDPKEVDNMQLLVLDEQSSQIERQFPVKENIPILVPQLSEEITIPIQIPLIVTTVLGEESRDHFVNDRDFTNSISTHLGSGNSGNPSNNFSRKDDKGGTGWTDVAKAGGAGIAARSDSTGASRSVGDAGTAARSMTDVAEVGDVGTVTGADGAEASCRAGSGGAATTIFVTVGVGTGCRRSGSSVSSSWVVGGRGTAAAMAYRRSLSARATVLIARAYNNPSFSYIPRDHHDQDNQDSTLSRREDHNFIQQRSSFGRVSQFSLGSAFIRYMSTSVGEGGGSDNKIELMSNVADVVSDATIATQVNELKLPLLLLILSFLLQLCSISLIRGTTLLALIGVHP